MNFNPYSRSHLGNPHPVYTALREQRPVHLNDRPRFSAISHFEDVEAALRQWQIFSSASGITLDGFSGIKPMIILMDPPRLTVSRRALQKAFTAKRIIDQENLIRRTARPLLDAISSEDEVELVSTFTGAVPNHGHRRDAGRRSV